MNKIDADKIRLRSNTIRLRSMIMNSADMKEMDLPSWEDIKYELAMTLWGDPCPRTEGEVLYGKEVYDLIRTYMDLRKEMIGE